MGMRLRENVYQFAVTVILLLISFTMVFPFLYILSVSFTDGSVYHPNSLILWPQKWSFDAYRLILSGSGFLNALKSTLFITVIGTPISVVLNCMMAYMLSRQTLPGRRWILNLVVFTLLFSPGLIPNYLLVKNLGLLNSWWAVILPGAANAWTLLVMKSFFQNIPSEVGESAKIDGCSEYGVFFRIVLPLSKAMLTAFSLFAAVGLWNTYFNAILYITESAKWPLQVFLQQVVMSSNISEFLEAALVQQMQQQVPSEIIKMAAVVVVSAPIIIVYPFLQKHFAKGVMIGSVKG